MSDRNSFKILLWNFIGLVVLEIFISVYLKQKSMAANVYKINKQQKTVELTNLKSDRHSYEILNDLFNKKDKGIKLKVVSQFYEGLAKFEQDGKYGYVDERGNIAVAAKYDEAGNFSEQLAAVVLNGKSFFINGTGRIVITLKDYDAYSNYRDRHMAFGGELPFIDYLYTLSEFNNGVAEVSKPKLPRDYQYKTQEEANGEKEFLCNAIDRTGKILGEDRLCEIKSN